MEFETGLYKYPWRRTLEIYDTILNDLIDMEYTEVYKHYPYSGGPYACSKLERPGVDNIKIECNGHNKITITLGNVDAGLE